MSALRFAFFALIVVFGLSGCVGAGPSVAPETATLSDVNRMSGFSPSIAIMSRDIRNAPSAFGSGSPPGFNAAWRKATAGRFDGPRMIRTVEARVQGRLSQADLSALAEFYGSPVGRKVVAAELAGARGNSPARLAEGLRLYSQVAASDPERATLYRRIVRAVRMEAIARDLMDATADNMIAGMAASIDDPAMRRQFVSTLRQYKNAQRGQIGAALNAGLAYSYRRLSKDDLRTYASFLETPPARRYYGAMLPAMRSVLASESRALGAALVASADD